GVRFKQAAHVTLPMAGVSGEAWVPGSPTNRRGGGGWPPFVATNNPVDVGVREVPAAPPPEFRGNNGDPRGAASATQTEMPVGTPFTFTVRLEGQGYLPRSGSLDLAGSPEFTRRFRVLANQDRALADNLREVTYTLRPNSAAVTEVPSVYVGYFDTKLDEF